MPDNEEYSLKTGEKGERQLDYLERACGKYSRAFLTRLGLQPGMHILDVGCGSGHMAFWPAKQVGPTGHVYAIDSSKAQLDIAIKKAEMNEITNISFHQSNVYDLSEFNNQSDLTYSRWLLFHVSDSIKACRSLCQTVKQSGILACEEGTAGTNEYYPTFEAHDILMSKIAELSAKKQYDPWIGLNILGIFQSLPQLGDIEVSFAQNAWYRPEDIQQFLLGMITLLDSSQESFIKYNILTEPEILNLKKAIQLHKITPGELALSTRITQISARRIAKVAY